MPASVNLITNGDFSAGNKGFSSDYTYVSPDPGYSTVVDQYSIVTNPGTQFGNDYSYFGDHTSDSGAMLLVDGTNTGDFWRQSVSLAANTTYSFSYFVTGADTESPAQVGLSLNGATVDAGVLLTAQGGGSKWLQVTQSFTTASAGAYSLGLFDVSGVAEGNDFAIDDVSLRQTLPPPTGKNLLVDGDFSSETNGFNSDYTYVSPGSGISTTVGEYSVVSDPSTAFANGYSSYGDHTTGAGRMLFVDGTNSGDFWRESVSLAAATTYAFTYFVTGADSSNLPAIAFSVNGSVVDAGFQVSAQGGGSGWQQVTASFTTSAKGAYTVALSDLDGVAEGNDFTLDDLSLVASRPGAPDKTPPTVTGPTGVTVVAASASGAPALFSASAQDLVDGPTDPVTFTESLAGGATQSAFSGEVFSLGRHAIVATATDSAGNAGSATFDIEVTSGVAVGAVVSSGSDQEVYGTATGTAIQSGGTQLVISTGLAVGTTVSGGGVLTVQVGGFTSDTRVLSGGLVSGPGMASGELTVVSGGVISGTCFGHGATDVFYAGASEASVTISSGATLDLVDAVVPIGAFVIGPVTSPEFVSGAYLISGAALKTLGATVQAGGNLEVASGGVAAATTVSDGGVETVSAGATAFGATVLSGGALTGPGALKGALVVSAGGTVTDLYIAPGTTVLDDGSLVYSGAVVETLAGALSGTGAIVEDGPGRLVVSGGTAAFTGLAACVAVLLTVGCAAAQPPVDYAAPSSWLCRPGAEAACTTGLDAIAIAADGTRTPVSFPPAADPPIDCFYVYPTVSHETADYADMAASPEVVATARRQAGRLATRCRLFAPIYRQLTGAGLGRVMSSGKEIDWTAPYLDVLGAWRWYMAHDNRGRGVVLVGHSQGTILLQRLIAEEIDGKPAQKRLVGAFLAGDPGLAVPAGRRVGGAFRSIPLCAAATEVGCVYVWADYLAGGTSPERLFGHSPGAGRVAGCVTPAAPGGGSGALKAFLPKPAYGPPEDPPSIELIGQLSAACQADAQGDVVQVSVLPGRYADLLRTGLGMFSASPAWGLHRLDLDLPQGDILDVLAAESATWARR